MPLHGSLETFALPDVLTLLASTAKSGELRVTDRGMDGRLMFQRGEFVGSAVSGAVDHTDAVFELLRLDEGSFTFTEGTPVATGDPEAVGPVLELAQNRLGVWREIEAVVPSMAALVTLAPALPEAEVTIDAERWQALVAVAGGSSVTVLAQRLELAAFAACRLVKELVDAGMVTVLPAPEHMPELPAAVSGEREGYVGEGHAGEGYAGEGHAGEGYVGAESASESGVDSGADSGALADLAGTRDADALAAWADLAGTDRAAAEEAGLAGDAGDTTYGGDTGEEGAAAAPADADDPIAALADAATRTPALTATDDHADLEDELDEPINRGLLLKFLSSVRS